MSNLHADTSQVQAAFERAAESVRRVNEMSVKQAAERLEPLFDGSPHVDWDNASRDVVADLVTLARDWFERRDSNRQLIREAIEEFWNSPSISSPLLPATANTTFREAIADPVSTDIEA